MTDIPPPPDQPVYVSIAREVHRHLRLKNPPGPPGMTDEQRGELCDQCIRYLNYFTEEHLPRGSGFDGSTGIDANNSTRNSIIIWTEFHHMNDLGYYDGWSTHTFTMTADLEFGFELEHTYEGCEEHEADFIFDHMREALDTKAAPYPPKGT